MHIPTILGITASCSVIGASGLVIYNQVNLLPAQSAATVETASFAAPVEQITNDAITSFANASIVEWEQSAPQLPKAELITATPIETSKPIKLAALQAAPEPAPSILPVSLSTNILVGTEVEALALAKTIQKSQPTRTVNKPKVTYVRLENTIPKIGFVSRADTSLIDRFAASIDLPEINGREIAKTRSEKARAIQKLKHNPWQIGAFR